jgi:hypothetical protein
MANDTHRVLWCFIKNDSNPFEVTAPVNASISRLKKLVWEKGKNGILSETDAKDLVLCKVSSELLADNAQAHFLLVAQSTGARRITKYSSSAH